MTVAPTERKVQYDGDDAAVDFAVTFIFYDNADLKVTHRDTSGNETFPVLDTDYTVTGGDGATGSVEFPIGGSSYSTLASGSPAERLTIRGNEDTARDADIDGSYQFSTLNLTDDKTMTMVQDIKGEVGRCIKFAESDEDSLTSRLDVDTERANKFLKFDANGNVDLSAGSVVGVHNDTTGRDEDDAHEQYALISSQAGAPSSTPSLVGEINIDTTAKQAYIAVGTASSADWLLSTRKVRYLNFNLVGPTTDVATGTNLYGDFTFPFGGTFLQSDSNPELLMASNSTAGITGTMVVDLSLNGTSIMTTNKLDIETTEKTSETAATQPDLTTTTFSAGDIITIDVDAVHSGTVAKGLHVNMAVLEDG